VVIAVEQHLAGAFQYEVLVLVIVSVLGVCPPGAISSMCVQYIENPLIEGIVAGGGRGFEPPHAPPGAR